MYINKTIDEILKDSLDLSMYKLCYIDRIPETVFDYTPESIEYMNRPEFNWEEEKKKWGYNSPYIRMADYPNPNYIEGEKEYYAYFTEKPIIEQWGDDWDDAPYEHNAGIPYDDEWDNNTKQRIHHSILVVPFYVGDTGTYWIKFPDYYGCGNSPWSVQEINHGAVPWIFAMTYGKRKTDRSSVVINAGIDPIQFIYKLSEIKNL